MKRSPCLLAVAALLGCYAPDITLTTCDHDAGPAVAVADAAVDDPAPLPDAGAGAEDADAGAAPCAPCAPCAAALAGQASFVDGSLGRAYDGACDDSAALWQSFYDWACATGRPCHLDCIDSFCLTGVPSGGCKGCVMQHPMEPSYAACAADE